MKLIIIKVQDSNFQLEFSKLIGVKIKKDSSVINSRLKFSDTYENWMYFRKKKKICMDLF